MPEAMPLGAPSTPDILQCWTGREIAQQPAMLRATQQIMLTRSIEIASFLKPLLADPSLRIVLTGAGTSDFIGQCIAPVLRESLGRRVEAIATTDIVGTPRLVLAEDVPTLLVSFGRSGNSPESIAAIAIAQNSLTRLHHLVITCNAEGALARSDLADSLILNLPDQVHDRGFAMTSSFTSMMYCALAAFLGPAAMATRNQAICAATESALIQTAALAGELANSTFDRAIFLGSGPFHGLAREAALKLLELTDGQIATLAETPLGFRHGPKTFINDRSLVTLFLSNDPLSRQYDLDMLAELRSDHGAARIITVDALGLSGADVALAELSGASDCDLLFPYIVLAQMFALHSSFALGLTPDNPSRSGTVNRVVQGVTIHGLD